MARTSPRRVSLPAADHIFRPIDPTAEELAQELGETARVRAVPDALDAADEAAGVSGRRRPSGRIRHDEKMTVYVTADDFPSKRRVLRFDKITLDIVLDRVAF